MKKFIFTANVIAILFLVPATIVGYLHEDQKETKAVTGEVAKKSNNGLEYGNIVRLVKTF